jgi:hypothetical protein
VSENPDKNKIEKIKKEEKFADHLLNEIRAQCQGVVREALIVEDDDTHCQRCG